MLAATEAFRLSVFPSIGILTLWSAKSCISFDTPFASFPIIITFLLYFILMYLADFYLSSKPLRL